MDGGAEVVPLRPADRAEEDTVDATAHFEHGGRKGRPIAVYGDAADDALAKDEGMPVDAPNCLEHTDRLLGDLWADAIAR